VLYKGHAPSSGIPLVVALATVLIVALAFSASAASFAPIGGGSTPQYDLLGRVSHHRYIGRTLPPRLNMVSTAQSGPDPDDNLTVEAVSTEELAPNAVPSINLNRLAFSTNGVDEDGDGRLDAELPDDANHDIWIMRPDGSEKVQITDLPGDQLEPAYHPGSNLIAFAGDQSGRWEIYTVEVASGIVQCLTDKQAGEKQHPTWSPDGNWLAYQGRPSSGDDWDIYKMPAAGDQPQAKLTTSAGDDTSPAWVPAGNPLSPGGTAIAYTAAIGASTRILYVDAITLNTDALSDGGGDGLASDRDPAWSWDAMHLAFASDRFSEGDTQRDYNIWRMSALGETSGAAAVLVSNLDATDTTDDLNPSWSAALQRQPLRIYYESDRADTAGAERDIWATFYADNDPASLQDLPFVNRGDETQARAREFAPGEDVSVHAQVYDKDSGVSRVFAWIKDPDLKIWDIRYWDTDHEWDSGFTGWQYLEWDYQVVAVVELFDDGAAENHDGAAGDGSFSGVWTMPPNLASDFVIDIFAIDNSGNSQNYDNVGGFTSEVFSPSGNTLLVNDYCEGQKFIYELGFNNDYGTAWMTESFYTFNPGFSESATNQTFGEAYSVTKDTIKAYAAEWGVDERYSIWRVICRGPVPPSVYQYYLPTVEYQLDPIVAADPESGPTAPVDREVSVSERVIIWASPHTGNIWVADGSLVDAGTQTDLGFFLDRGGRLLLSGSDVAWALTLNGTVQNSFLSQYLRASFVSDAYANNLWHYIGFGPNRLRSQRVSSNFTMVGQSTDPVAYDPWVLPNGGFVSGWNHWHVLAWGPVWDSDDMPTSLTTPNVTGGEPSHQDAHPYSWRPDIIQESANTVKLYGYGGFDGPTAGLRYVDPATSAHLIFLSFGFESIHRSYHDPSGDIPPPHCMNHRATLMHNALCWMRTGGFQGRVVDIAGSKPITGPNPIVLAWHGVKNVGDRTTPPDYAVRCQDDGTYTIAGVAPGFYTLEAIRPGFEIDHYDGYVTHGGWEPFVVDFAISRARPGVVSGTVTSEATGDALALVEVKVWAVPEEPEEEEEEATATTSQTNGQVEPDWDALGDPIGSGSTSVDGSYKIEDLVPGDYYIRADGAGIGYGDAWAQITITAGNTTTQDFELPAADGTLIATVTDAADSSAIANARVTLTTATGLQLASGLTDATGTATISTQPGTYGVLALAGGYEEPEEQGAVIVSNDTASVAFSLDAEPPGSLTGRVVSATTGGPVGGVLIRLLSNDVIIATTTSAAELTDPGGGQGTYNYRFDNVPTGQNTVRPAPVGFTASPTERVATVQTGLTTPNVDFTLNSLHVFPAGLQLVSAPFDYSSVDPALVVGHDAGDLKMATWEGSRQRYRTYPQAPADRFRLGSGYWMRLYAPADVIVQGPNAPDPMPIALTSGWNLVGDPFPTVVDFYSALVEDQSGVVRTIQEALSEGLIEGGMFAYVLGGYQNTAVFNPWVGTWLKTNANLTLHVSQTAGALASPAAAGPAVPAPEDGWIAGLRVSVDGLVDTATHFGLARSATAGYDVGIDMGKPPAVDFEGVPYVYAAFVNGEWGGRSGNYSMDVRSADAGQSKWRLQVATSQSGSEVTLRWPDLSSADSGARPVLHDVDASKAVYMRTCSGYTYRAGSEPRVFEIVLGSASSAPVAVTGVTAQQLRDGGGEIAFSLSKDAAVDVSIMNIAGRAVRHVCAAKAHSAGANTTSWNGLSDAGTRVPRGRYVVRVTARAEDGQQATAVGTLMVGR